LKEGRKEGNEKDKFLARFFLFCKRLGAKKKRMSTQECIFPPNDSSDSVSEKLSVEVTGTALF